MPTTTQRVFARFPSKNPRRRAGFADHVGAKIGLGLLVGMSALVIGCQTPTQPTGPTEMVLDIPDYDAFVDASLSVLRRYDFPPDRVDRPRGLVVTEPATSGQWFEFWRIDSQGGYQTLESSLHTLRRKVTVSILPANTDNTDAQPTTRTAAAEPAPSSRQYRLQVQVNKERYSAPERQITTASGALGIYNERIPTSEGLRKASSRGAHWIPLGRDPLLEAVLLAELADALPSVTPAD